MNNRFLAAVSIEELRDKIYRAKAQSKGFTRDQKYSLLKLANNPNIRCWPGETTEYAQYHELLRKGSLNTATEDEQNLAKIYFAALALQLGYSIDLIFLEKIIFDREEKKLNLSFRCIEDDDVLYLSHILPVTAITKLNLQGNYIGDEGAEVLATIQTLISLNLANNYIHDRGVKALAANQTLMSLDVHGMRVGAESRKILMESSPITRHNLGKSVGIKTNFPSLLSIAGFYSQKYRTVKLSSGETLQQVAEYSLPEEVKEKLNERKIAGCYDIKQRNRAVKSGCCNIL